MASGETRSRSGPSESPKRESNIVTQLVSRLRKKLDPEGRIDPIETVQRDGYRFAVERGPSAEPVVTRRRKWKW